MAKRRFYIQWHLLDRCNLRCRHCYQDNFEAGEELNWSELQFILQNILRTMEKWGTYLEVALTGGEPFLKKELPSLLASLEASPSVAAISIITNGLVFPPWIGELKKWRKFKELRISLDGFTARTNDEIRGKGTYEKVLAGIKKIEKNQIPFLLMFTVMKRNLQEAPWLGELARKVRACGFIIERFFPLGQGKNWLNEVLLAEDFLNLWQQILERYDLNAEPEDLIPFRAIKVIFGKDKIKVYGSACVVGRDGLALMPDGTIFPCRRFPLPLGNLLTQPLDEIWANVSLLQEVREKERLKGNCHSCPLKKCFGCRAMSYVLSNDPLAPDPHCWLTSPLLKPASSFSGDWSP